MSEKFAMLQAVRDLLFPPVCQFCGFRDTRVDLGICERCLQNIRYIVSPLCTSCGVPLMSGDDHLCGVCLRHSHSFSMARSVVHYEDPVRNFVHRLKYMFDTTTCEPFLKIARSFNFSPFDECDLFLPVPLHKTRLKKKGYEPGSDSSTAIFPG